MQQICGSIRYNNEAIPIMVDKDGIPYFMDSVSNTKVYLEGDIPANLLTLTRDRELEQADYIAFAMSSGGDQSLGIILGDTVAGIRFTASGSYECVRIKELHPRVAELVSKFPNAAIDALATLYFRAKLYAGAGRVASWANAFSGTEGAAKKYDHTDYVDLLKDCGVDAAWLCTFVNK